MNMLKINRLRIEINTTCGLYGIDERFESGLNFIASLDNTCGKSSIVAAIYYCLGFEQIIGGVGGIGHKVLTSVFKSSVDDSENTMPVIESRAYLEINNGVESVVIRRTMKDEYKDDKLITVFYGGYDNISNPETQQEDFYVHSKNSATREKGFHTFLEEFLHLRLPLVRCSDGSERKLYLQVLFSAMFIEQKNGWSNIMSGMPFMGIRESRKRIVEYIIGLDALQTEKEHEMLKLDKAQIEFEWKRLLSDAHKLALAEACSAINIPAQPRVLTKTDYSRMSLITSDGASISETIAKLQTNYDNLNTLKPYVSDNFEALSSELSEIEGAIHAVESEISNIIIRYASGNDSISQITATLGIINSDIRNNEDALRLQKLGSEVSDNNLSVDICPTCNQSIQDTLLFTGTENPFMSIDENLKHLKEQKKMLDFSLNSYRKTQNELQHEKLLLESKIQTLRRLAQSIRSDLNTTTDTEISEAIVLKRVETSILIERLGRLSNDFDNVIADIKVLSDRWNKYLIKKENLPKSDTSDSDKEKITLLKEKFISNLKRFQYNSVSNLDSIVIPEETLMPTIDGFDMKFDSSASDGIRLIWAFTIALLQVSIEKDGNHPGVIIFDEPKQHSIVPRDMESFINAIAELGASCQIITAITLESSELTEFVRNLTQAQCYKIDIDGKAFKQMS